jgi:hypothetical protein
MLTTDETQLGNQINELINTLVSLTGNFLGRAGRCSLFNALTDTVEGT